MFLKELGISLLREKACRQSCHVQHESRDSNDVWGTKEYHDRRMYYEARKNAFRASKFQEASVRVVKPT